MVQVPGWATLKELLHSRLEHVHERLESVDEKNFKFEQGRGAELHFLLDLGDTAKAVLDGDRVVRKTHVHEL